jgi:hypothetical protein
MEMDGMEWMEGKMGLNEGQMMKVDFGNAHFGGLGLTNRRNRTNWIERNWAHLGALDSSDRF